MKIIETKQFLERIKIYYPTFIVDDYTIQEWHSQLKEYSNEDINNKFEEHLKSEEYSKYIPKISFLTKFLTKEKDKGMNNANVIYTNCQLCGKGMLLSEYQKHFEKCSSVDYIVRQIRRFKGKIVSREEIEQLSDEKFNELYEKVVDLTYQNGTALEKFYIEKYRESA